MNQIKQIQKQLKEENKDAWIIVDYEGKHPVIKTLFAGKMLTRKLFLTIPKKGKPYLICHKIDTVFLSDSETKKNFDLYVYQTWSEMISFERKLFGSYEAVLMDVSESGLLPKVSLADFGSVSFIKDMGIKITSSQDLLQIFSARFDQSGHESQKRACEESLRIKDLAFLKIKEDILNRGYSDEYEIQQFICEEYHKAGMVYDYACIVAVNHNASDPHYGPTEKEHSLIRKGDVVLIDMWAKFQGEKDVYSDITWMGYVGEEVPEEIEDRFEVLRDAIDQAVLFLRTNLTKRKVMGFEVDDVTRTYIEEKGYGKYFIHRTGHNIADGESPHGPGVNIDNYESHDTRTIIPYISFSLEPGIYAPDFGMRSETDIFITEKYEVEEIGGRQRKVIPILK